MSVAKLPAIAIHGGAWGIPENLAGPSVDGVQRAARAGHDVLAEGGSALDAVVAAICVMEDDPAFDAGTGSVLTLDGEVEMDAVVMEGRNLRAGGVACVQNIKNPCILAREVLEKTEHVLLVGPGANKFADECGIPTVQADSLITDTARAELEHFKKYKTTINVLFNNRNVPQGHDTVGAVAVDKTGCVAFCTSTGGITAKRPGRVGDTSIVGDYLVTYHVAHVPSLILELDVDVNPPPTTARQLPIYPLPSGVPCQEAADRGLEYMTERVGSAGGVVVVSSQGDIGFSFTTDRMAWAWARGGELHYGLDAGQHVVASL
ncbi:LOW QUALITY PROTEIN: isoaspartyl peptidase/L-asparaginase-like [Haliotis rubra]|uniref:LOW QUALITY PROTEIN: isoaspartyl peptidase/L-asparaginase-like n=1 Tax=Haliotis rubra TaxID=36100 RepID=UPI001EE5638C|nr:LOW QUALITY PROTEIN: isoaspartyl peptidase/L-asparaginase-like [Haliotis rubra]